MIVEGQNGPAPLINPTPADTKATGPAPAPAPDAGGAPDPKPQGDQSKGDGGTKAPIVPSIGDEPAKPDAGKPVGPESTAVTYEPTGDVGLDMALEFFGKLGFGPESSGIKAATNGDFQVLEAQLSMLGDKAAGYERFMALAQRAFNDTQAKTKAAADARDKMVNDIFGEGVWPTVREWAAGKASDEEKAYINGALKAGGLQAKTALLWMKGIYDRDTGVTREAKDGRQEGAPGGQPSNSGALSPRQYSEAVQELARVNRGNPENDPQAYAALQRRFAMYRG